MNHILSSLLIIILLAVGIYLLADRWQDIVHIYASGCETESGTELPRALCKAIVNYRYQKDN